MTLEGGICCMSDKIKETINVDKKDGWETLTAWLPSGWKEKMSETKCFVRAREIKSAKSWLRVLFAYPVLDKSLEDISRWLDRQNIAKITAPSLWQRMQKSVSFLLWLCYKIMKSFVEPVETDLNLVVVDATTFSLPASKKRDWIMTLMWSNGNPVSMKLNKLKGKGTGESLKNIGKLSKKSVIVGDRAYGTPPQISYAIQNDQSFIVRFTWNNLPLYEDEKGKKPLNPYKVLRHMRQREIRDFHAWVCPKSDKPCKVRIVAVKKDNQIIQRDRRKSRAESKRKGHTPRKLTIFMAAFVTIVTDLSESQASKEVIADAYRWRRQIELEFKRFKSITKTRKLINKNDEAVKAYLLGLLAAWLLTQTIARKKVFFPWGYPLEVSSKQWNP